MGLTVDCSHLHRDLGFPSAKEDHTRPANNRLPWICGDVSIESIPSPTSSLKLGAPYEAKADQQPGLASTWSLPQTTSDPQIVNGGLTLLSTKQDDAAAVLETVQKQA